MRGMRIVAMILLGILAGYFYRDSAPAVALERLIARPCAEPITYAIDTIDARFGLSPDALADALLDAEKLWEDALGINLFTFTEATSSRTIPINFIYDNRQMQSDVSSNVRTTLGDEKSKLTAMEEERDELVAKYEEALAVYNDIRIAYEQRLATYNKAVGEWNQKGGAPKDVYDELAKEGEALDEEMQKVVAAGKALTKLTEEINVYNDVIASHVENYNDLVNSYNETFHQESAFAQGTFGARTINIYQFGTAEELRIVLAHELGHALGMGHVEGDTSIMYAKTGSQSLTTGLSKQDIAHAKEICGI